MHAYAYTYVRTYVYTHMHAYIHSYICAYTHTRIHIYSRTLIYTLRTYTHTCTCANTYTYMRSYTHTHTHAHTNTYKHTHTHTHTYIYGWSNPRNKQKSIRIYALKLTINKFVYSNCIEFQNSGADEFFDGLFLGCCLLKTFCCRKLSRSLKKMGVSRIEICWACWVRSSIVTLYVPFDP